MTDPTPAQAAFAAQLHLQFLLFARWIELDWRNAEIIAHNLEAVAFAMNAETKSEQKARLTDAYERKMITGHMLAELIAMHGLEGRNSA